MNKKETELFAQILLAFRAEHSSYHLRGPIGGGCDGCKLLKYFEEEIKKLKSAKI